MRFRAQPITARYGNLLPAAAVLVVVLAGGPVRAQQPFLSFNWFAGLQASWVDQYWADDSSDDGIRLAELPDMFGDTFARGGDLFAKDDTLLASTTTVVLAGGSRGLKPSEHNKALPDNRAYVAYHHFHNAISTQVEDPPGTVVLRDQSSVDQYLLGLESRFGNGLWSAELRMPFTHRHDFFAFSGAMSVENDGGEIGNLSVLLKRLVYYNPCTSVVAGLGIETPTGSDFLSRTNTVSFRVSNDAVHLVPYIGFLHSPNDRWFLHGFVEMDVALSGNRITFVDANGPGDGGKFNDQTLLYVDVGVGRWLHRDPCARLITGVATLAEFHYTTTLENTDAVAGALAPGTGAFTMTNLANRVDVVNLTAAVHMEIAGSTSLRVGGVFPITIGDDRFFDAELAAQLIRRF